MNKQIVHFTFPGMTSEQYGNMMDSLHRDNPNVPGRIHHISCVKGNDIEVIGVWESIQAFNNFYNQILTPHFKRQGLKLATPTIMTLYNEYSGVEANVSH